MPSCCDSVEWHQDQPAPLALWRLLRANVPMTRNLGIYVNRNVAGTKTLSAHAYGRAIDIGLSALKAGERHIGDVLFRDLIDCHDEMGLDHVIWNRKIWSAERGGPRAYSGVSPHTDHLHIAFTEEGSQRTVFPRFQMRVAVLFTGLDDLRRRRENIA